MTDVFTSDMYEGDSAPRVDTRPLLAAILADARATHDIIKAAGLLNNLMAPSSQITAILADVPRSVLWAGESVLGTAIADTQRVMPFAAAMGTRFDGSAEIAAAARAALDVQTITRFAGVGAAFQSTHSLTSISCAAADQARDQRDLLSSTACAAVRESARSPFNNASVIAAAAREALDIQTIACSADVSAAFQSTRGITSIFGATADHAYGLPILPSVSCFAAQESARAFGELLQQTLAHTVVMRVPEIPSALAAWSPADTVTLDIASSAAMQMSALRDDARLLHPQEYIPTSRQQPYERTRSARLRGRERHGRDASVEEGVHNTRAYELLFRCERRLRTFIDRQLCACWGFLHIPSKR